jgi:hypothetical protein
MMAVEPLAALTTFVCVCVRRGGGGACVPTRGGDEDS